MWSEAPQDDLVAVDDDVEIVARLKLKLLAHWLRKDDLATGREDRCH
jgi:hypothetical protein